MIDYLARRDAAQATLDRYLGKPLAWGETDCARVVAHALRQLGRPAPLSKFGPYKTPLGAKRALLKAGYADLGQVMDGLGYLRIPPAAALPCDVIGLAAEELDVSLALALGNGRVLGFHGDAEGAVVMQPLEYVAAWSAV